MSVATHLGLDPASTAFIELELHWAGWVEQFPRLAQAGDFHTLRGWLAAAEPAEADEVLHTLATLGSPSGADDLAAASVLAWALLPGACALAHRLRGLSAGIDEVVAAQLWLEIRTFSPTPALAYSGSAAHAAKRSEPIRHGPILTWLIRPPASGIDTQQGSAPSRRPPTNCWLCWIPAVQQT